MLQDLKTPSDVNPCRKHLVELLSVFLIGNSPEPASEEDQNWCFANLSPSAYSMPLLRFHFSSHHNDQLVCTRQLQSDRICKINVRDTQRNRESSQSSRVESCRRQHLPNFGGQTWLSIDFPSWPLLIWHTAAKPFLVNPSTLALEP